MEGEKIVTIEESKKFYLQKFKELHDDFSDVIPDEMLSGTTRKNPNKYKVRGQWFATVRNHLDNASRLNLFPEEYNKKWRLFFEAYSNRVIEKQNMERTTKEEIDTANSLLIEAQKIIS